MLYVANWLGSVDCVINVSNIPAQAVDYLCFSDEECSYLDNNSYCQQVKESLFTYVPRRLYFPALQ
jgi:hypothetical protein